MKELTIEEKAERYDELLKKLRKAKEDNNVCDERYCCVIDDIVPELKESEDERIRQRIIHALHGDVLEMSEIKEATDWLEKQENKKDNLSVDFDLGYLGIKPAYKDGNAWCILLGDNIQEGICGFGDTKEEALIAFIKELIEERDKKSVVKLKVSDELYEHIRNTCVCIDNAYSTATLSDMIDYLSTAKRSAQSAFDMIEKQGERKPNPYSGTSFEYNGHTWGMCARDNGVDILYDKHIIGHFEKQGATKLLDYDDFAPKSAMEAAKEEKVDSQNCVKSVDKVEHKFEVGNWITFYGGKPFKILDIKREENGSLDYLLLNQDGHNSYYNKKYVDTNAKLWTIADAKDCDVLMLSYASKHYILIYKRLYEKGFRIIMSVYCFYCVEEDTYYDETDNFHVMNRGEIITPATKEQRDTLFTKLHEAGYEWDDEKKELKHIEQKPVPKFEVGDVMRTLQESADNITSGLPVVVSIDDEYYLCNNELIAIKNQDDYEYPPMNRKQKLWSEEDELALKQAIYVCHQNGYTAVENWLKSLKDRVQPKQEWSEEDEDNFKHLMDEIVCLGNSRNSANRLHYDRLIKFLYELKNRAQPREEWRGKDERMLDRLIAYFEKQVAFTDDDNPRYAKWLKFLRPQNRWKPSEEQLKSLQEVIDTGHFTSYPNALETLYEQLKKLRDE